MASLGAPDEYVQQLATVRGEGGVASLGAMCSNLPRYVVGEGIGLIGGSVSVCVWGGGGGVASLGAPDEYVQQLAKVGRGSGLNGGSVSGGGGGLASLGAPDEYVQQLATVRGEWP